MGFGIWDRLFSCGELVLRCTGSGVFGCVDFVVADFCIWFVW